MFACEGQDGVLSGWAAGARASVSLYARRGGFRHVTARLGRERRNVQLSLSSNAGYVLVHRAVGAGRAGMRVRHLYGTRPFR